MCSGTGEASTTKDAVLHHVGCSYCTGAQPRFGDPQEFRDVLNALPGSVVKRSPRLWSNLAACHGISGAQRCVDLLLQELNRLVHTAGFVRRVQHRHTSSTCSLLHHALELINVNRPCLRFEHVKYRFEVCSKYLILRLYLEYTTKILEIVGTSPCQSVESLASPTAPFSMLPVAEAKIVSVNVGGRFIGVLKQKEDLIQGPRTFGTIFFRAAFVMVRFWGGRGTRSVLSFTRVMPVNNAAFHTR